MGYCCQGAIVTGDPAGGNEQPSCVSAQAESQEKDACQLCLENGTIVASRNGNCVVIFNYFLHVVNFLMSTLLSVSLGYKTKTKYTHTHNTYIHTYKHTHVAISTKAFL